MSKSIPVIVLGIEIGTASGWDKMDINEIVFYNFKSKTTLAAPKGCKNLNINYNEGFFTFFDSENGDKIKEYKILEVLRNAN